MPASAAIWATVVRRMPPRRTHVSAARNNRSRTPDEASGSRTSDVPSGTVSPTLDEAAVIPTGSTVDRVADLSTHDTSIADRGLDGAPTRDDNSIGRPSQSTRRHCPSIDDDATIAAALEDVSIPTLMLSLVHMTGDAALIRGGLKPQGLFLNEVQGYMSEDDKAEVRALALDVIRDYRDGGCQLPAAARPGSHPRDDELARLRARCPTSTCR